MECVCGEMERFLVSRKSVRNKIPKKGTENYARYTGIVFEMLGIIVLGSVGGVKLDEMFNTGSTWTVVCTLISVFLAMFMVLKNFIPPSK